MCFTHVTGGGAFPVFLLTIDLLTIQALSISVSSMPYHVSPYPLYDCHHPRHIAPYRGGSAAISVGETLLTEGVRLTLRPRVLTPSAQERQACTSGYVYIYASCVRVCSQGLVGNSGSSRRPYHQFSRGIKHRAISD